MDKETPSAMEIEVHTKQDSATNGTETTNAGVYVGKSQGLR